MKEKQIVKKMRTNIQGKKRKLKNQNTILTVLTVKRYGLKGR